MTFDEKYSKELCESFLKANSEEEITEILKKGHLLDNDKYWRPLGDSFTNYSTAGSQQSNATGALVEKLVNAIDANLIAACRKKGIDPTSRDAPQTMKQAAELFFDILDGDLRNTDKDLRKILADRIKLIASGKRTGPCYTIVDSGEGQLPDDMPDTFLSIPGSKKSANKTEIPFVQGLFNMGGTGALRFCGKENYQLIITRRDPELLTNKKEEESPYGFTIIRRKSPRKGVRESSFYEYQLNVDK